MTARLRPVLIVVFALVLALTSGAMAVARGQTHTAGMIVLCTGTGPVAVAVDAKGQPVGPAHICPDCALSLIVALPAPDPAARALSASPVVFRPAPRPPAATPVPLSARARAPPLA